MGLKTTILDFLGRQVSDAELEEVGFKLADKLYFQEIALYIAISYIANTISKCEIKTYEAGKEVQNELYYLLNVNPNPNQSSSQFMNQVIEEYYYRGEALVVPYRNRIYCSDGFGIEENPWEENRFTNVSIENQSIADPFKASEVFYFKLDNKRVSALVRGLFDDYGAVLNSAIESFLDGTSEKYKLVLENYQAGDAKFAQDFNTVIKKHLETFMKSDRAVYPQFRGQDLQRMDRGGYTASASDIVSMRKEVFEITAQAFKIPLSMMYGNITNMAEIVKVYLSFCIDPLAQMLSEELTRKTTDFEEWRRGTRVVVDTSAINHIDLMDVADKADKLIASGVACIDDVRKRLGMQPLDTDYSTAHYLTKNYSSIDEAANMLGADETGGGESDGEA